MQLARLFGSQFQIYWWHGMVELFADVIRSLGVLVVALVCGTNLLDGPLDVVRQCKGQHGWMDRLGSTSRARSLVHRRKESAMTDGVHVRPSRQPRSCAFLRGQPFPLRAAPRRRGCAALAPVSPSQKMCFGILNSCPGSSGICPSILNSCPGSSGTCSLILNNSKGSHSGTPTPAILAPAHTRAHTG